MAKYIALTFDDGPNTVTTPMVLDVLEKHSAVGTFFLEGNNINEESAKVVRTCWKCIKHSRRTKSCSG